MRITPVLKKKHSCFGDKASVLFPPKSSGAFSKIMPNFFENHAELFFGWRPRYFQPIK